MRELPPDPRALSRILQRVQHQDSHIVQGLSSRSTVLLGLCGMQSCKVHTVTNLKQGSTYRAPHKVLPSIGADDQRSMPIWRPNGAHCQIGRLAKVVITATATGSSKRFDLGEGNSVLGAIPERNKQHPVACTGA